MTWIQGGPLLEVSFLLTLESDRSSFMTNLMATLSTITPKIRLATAEDGLRTAIREFVDGNPEDAHDLNSLKRHTTSIPVYVDTDGERKANLYLAQISDNLVAVDLSFWGSVFDVPELDQRGIMDAKLPMFKNLLHDLFDAFDFIVGTVGFDVSVNFLFNTEEAWPHESYNMENISTQSLMGDNRFLLVRVNRRHLDLQDKGGQ